MSTLVWDDVYILQHVRWYMSYACGSVHPFGVDREIFLILS
jgi:hypothetical protein